jgi:glycosyltransferase involved in cell wall biosynthesis
VYLKVAFIFMHPFSESMGSVVRVRELALSLGRSGVEAFIITPYEQCRDLSKNVHVVSVGSSVFQSAGLSRQFYGFSKYLYYRSVFPYLYSKLASKLSRILPGLIKGIAEFLVKEEVDIVQVEQDAALPIGISLKEATSLPLVADLHNISSEELVAIGSLERSSDEFLKMQASTAMSLSKTDHVVVVSDPMRDYVVANYGISYGNVSVVPPGGRPIVDGSVLKKREEPFKVVYAGLVASREHVDLFVKSIPFVKKHDSSVLFFMTDKGEAIGKVKKLALNLGVTPNFFWYDDYNMVNSFLSSCHIGIICSSADIARQMGTPAKLFTYLSAGLPVVANDVGAWSRIIDEEKVGLLTENTPEDFARAVNELLGNEHLWNEFSYNALNAVAEKYNWDRSREALVKVYESLS